MERLALLPDPWTGIVLALATFRCVRFIGWDDLPLLVRLRARLTGENKRGKGVDLYRNETWYLRPVLAKLVHCPWCVGFWLGILVYVAWLFEPTGTLYAAFPFALNGAVGLIAKNWDP